MSLDYAVYAERFAEVSVRCAEHEDRYQDIRFAEDLERTAFTHTVAISLQFERPMMDRRGRSRLAAEIDAIDDYFKTRYREMRARLEPKR